jgi:glycosyltransferase involved in cell wall biosynthesis
MILFLEYSAGGKRGGEKYTARLHAFLRGKYDVIPDILQPRPVELSNPLRQLLCSRRAVEKFRPDLVVNDVSSGTRNVLAISWASRRKKRILTIIQEKRMHFRLRNNFVVRWIVRLCENYLLKRANIILVNSRYIANYAQKRSGSNPTMIIALPGIENKGDLGPKPFPVAHSTRPRLLLVGECTRRKGIEYLVRAIPLLGFDKVQLAIAGGYSPKNPYYRKIERLVNKFHLEGEVNFLGYLDRNEILELMKESQIYLQPSLSEGYGIAIAEALASGLPIIASRVGGIPEIVEDGVNGILVPPKNPKALADAIKELIADKELWERIHLNNLAKAKSLPTWDDFDRTLERELVPAIERLTGLVARKAESDI